MNLIKNKLMKLLFSLFFFAGAFLCFYFPKKSITSVVYKYYNEKTVIIEDDGTKLFFNYIGLFLLVMTIWIWRKELKINQLGIIGGNDIEPIDPDNFPKDTAPDSPTPIVQYTEMTQVVNETVDFENAQRQVLKERIIAFFKARPYGLTNVIILANTFSVSKQTVESILFELMKENFVRRDTYPGSGKSNYSLSSSIENRAIDDFIKHFKIEILSDNRFVRIGQRYEADAIIRTDLSNYIIEVKRLESLSTKRIDDTIKQLMAIEEKVKFSPVKLVLIIATNKELDKNRFEDYQSIENLIIHFFNYEK
jgi:uncharacterized protein (UPF0335 family)